MTINEMLLDTPAKAFQLREKRAGVYQLIAPIFHADGDMVSIYLEEKENDQVKISDRGMSLMRLSYVFDIDSDNKRKILEDIILSRGATQEDGDIQLVVPGKDIYSGIMSFAQLVSEVCNMDILSREIVSNLFYDYLGESMEQIQQKTKLSYIKDYEIKGHPEIKIDYAFLGKEGTRPIFLFGVKDTNKAQQTTINCLNMKIEHISHKSICVFEDIDKVSTFARNALLNASGKVYSHLDSFKESGAEYLIQEIAG